MRFQSPRCCLGVMFRVSVLLSLQLHLPSQRTRPHSRVPSAGSCHKAQSSAVCTSPAALCVPGEGGGALCSAVWLSLSSGLLDVPRVCRQGSAGAGGSAGCLSLHSRPYRRSFVLCWALTIHHPGEVGAVISSLKQPETSRAVV